MLRRTARALQQYPQGYPSAAAAAAGGAAAGGHHHHHPQAQHQQGGGMHRSSNLDPRMFIRRVPRNTVVNIVPQGEMWVVERFGKFHKTQSPGMAFFIPFVDRIRYSYSSKEQGIMIPHQSAITRDNVMVNIDGVLFLRIVDAEKASYNIDNPIFNLINLAQTTMRSEIGKLKLDTLFEERDQLNLNIIDVIKREAYEWGVECKRYEIRDIAVSDIVRQSMDLQAEAERRKRKLILESEGEGQADANRAMGRRQAQEHMAEAELYTTVKAAEGQAKAIELTAKATAESIKTLSESLASNPNANQAVSLRVAEQYLEQFGNIAKEGNTVVLSSPVNDPASFATQALSVFNSISKSGAAGALPGPTGTSPSPTTPPAQ